MAGAAGVWEAATGLLSLALSKAGHSEKGRNTATRAHGSLGYHPCTIIHGLPLSKSNVHVPSIRLRASQLRAEVSTNFFFLKLV